MNEMQHFVIDVDGVMTDGGFYYTTEGNVVYRCKKRYRHEN